jgi:hypothetical protein
VIEGNGKVSHMTSTTRIRKAIAALVVISVLALPSMAAAAPASDPGVYRATQTAQPLAQAPDLIVTQADQGFSWSDAGVGATIALAALAIASGFALAVRAYRADRNRFRLT